MANKPPKKRAPRKKKADETSAETEPKSIKGSKAKAVETEPAKAAEGTDEPSDGEGSARRGWWQRTFGE